MQKDELPLMCSKLFVVTGCARSLLHSAVRWYVCRQLLEVTVRGSWLGMLRTMII